MIKTYWWDERQKFHNPQGIYNFGDQLTSTILAAQGVAHEWAQPEDAELIVCGSILEHMPCCWNGTVVGAGKLFSDSELHLFHTNFLAVRGPLTAQDIGKQDVALGDPGLLASDLIIPKAVFHDLGVIPHWSDTKLKDKFAYGYLIDPCSGPMWVMEQIIRCKRIVTSSLHGAIVADSFGIPRQLEPSNEMEDDFKFWDYALSIGLRNPGFGEMIEVPSHLVDVRKKEIRDALAQIS